jgi:hypothetical protein
VLEVLLVHHLIQDSLLVLVQAEAVVPTAVRAVLRIPVMLSFLKVDLVDLGVQPLAALVVLNMTMVLQMLVKAALVVTYNRRVQVARAVIMVVPLLQVGRQVAQEQVMVKQVRLRQETLVKYRKHNIRKQ